MAGEASLTGNLELYAEPARLENRRQSHGHPAVGVSRNAGIGWPPHSPRHAEIQGPSQSHRFE